jgi:hypothetical protein
VLVKIWLKIKPLRSKPFLGYIANTLYKVNVKINFTQLDYYISSKIVGIRILAIMDGDNFTLDVKTCDNYLLTLNVKKRDNFFNACKEGMLLVKCNKSSNNWGFYEEWNACTCKCFIFSKNWYQF